MTTLQGENAWWESNHTFEDLAKTLQMDFIAAVGKPEDVLADPGLTNIGRQPFLDFYARIGDSVALVSALSGWYLMPLVQSGFHGTLQMGVGHPPLSPTPYDSLCRELFKQAISLAVSYPDASFPSRGSLHQPHSRLRQE